MDFTKTRKKPTLYSHLSFKGTFLSEDTDVFVITLNRRTFFFPETENCLEIEDALKFESLEACKRKKVTFGRLGQP